MNFGIRLLLLFAMIFCHLIDDYKIQGILANMKQRAWWKQHTNNNLYKNDYKIALIEHAFSWSFTMTLPLFYIAVTQNNIILTWILIVSYFINTFFHANIDDLKANKMSINLVEDQILHLVQIICTWAIAIAAV